MIVGVGVDVVDIARFTRSIERTPALLDRLFLPEERDRSVTSLAGRFAAKEALAKALTAGHLSWRHAQVVSGPIGEPSFVLSGTVAEWAARRGVRHTHLSISHDGGVAMAFVVAEG